MRDFMKDTLVEKTNSIINSYGISNVGNRSNNEDSILLKKIDNMYLLAVADGVGGHNAGEIASKMAVDILEETVKEECNDNTNLSNENIKECLKKAYEKAHNMIKEHAVGDKEGMATTLTTAIVKKNMCFIANCGDSRAYLIRNGKITFRTKDHSFVQELLDNGTITEEGAKNHPYKNIITHALGLDELKVDIYEVELKEGDVLLLSSDGLHDYVDEEEILKVIEIGKNPKEIVEELLKIALEKTRDNVSIVVYKACPVSNNTEKEIMKTEKSVDKKIESIGILEIDDKLKMELDAKIEEQLKEYLEIRDEQLKQYMDKKLNKILIIQMILSFAILIVIITLLLH
jgi:protein phosphatase